MNNAVVFNDGNSVYFNSSVSVHRSTKVILIILNIAIAAFFGTLSVYMLSEDEVTKGTFFTVFVVFPAVYFLSIGLISLWNLFGKENIIINVKSIGWRKDFGLWKTPWNFKQYKSLYYCIVPQDTQDNTELGTIDFIDNSEMGVPIVIFSSSVNVPIEYLTKLVSELDVVFSIEHLTNDGENFIHLN